MMTTRSFAAIVVRILGIVLLLYGAMNGFILLMMLLGVFFGEGGTQGFDKPISGVVLMSILLLLGGYSVLSARSRLPASWSGALKINPD